MQKNEIVYKEQITSLFLNILELVNYEVQDSSNYEKDFKKKMKFQKLTDRKKLLASVYLLNDTELALISFFTYQLGDKRNNNNDFGEKNIRLYGVLNSVYLQIGAYETLMNLMNFPNRKEVMNKLRDLEIYKLRGMAGSHTVGYIYDEDILRNNPNIDKTTSFRIVQVSLEKTGDRKSVV